MSALLLSAVLAVTSYGYVFLTGHRATVDGAALQAIAIAYDRAPENVRRSLEAYTVSAGRQPDNSYSIEFAQFGPDARPGDVPLTIQVAAKDVADKPQPANSRPIVPFESSPVLLGSDLRAFLAANGIWHAYLRQRGWRHGPLSAKAVVVQQLVYLGKLEYSVNFTNKWYVSGTLGCDDQVMIDPSTFAPATKMSSIC